MVRVSTSAEKLLAHARAQVERDHKCEAAHVLLAALQPDTQEIPASKILEKHIWGSNRDHLIKFLQVCSDCSDATVISQSRRMKDKRVIEDKVVIEDEESLKAYRSHWESLAAEKQLVVTDTLIIWVILGDLTLKSLLEASKIKSDSLRKDLEEKLEYDTSSSTNHTHSSEASAKALQIIEKGTIKPEGDTSIVIDRRMHTNYIDNFLTVLGMSANSLKNEIAVVFGRNGSPIDQFEKLLVRRLQFSDRMIGQRGPLQSYKQVWRIDIGQLRLHGTLAPEILQIIKEKAIKEKAVIVLTNLDKLRRRNRDPLDEKLRMLVADRGKGIICALHVYYNNPPSPLELSLGGVLNIKRVRVEADNKETTKGFLKQYYYPLWDSMGYTFDDNAFDTILDLEPGAWIDEERMTLPYLAVRLGNDTITTVLDGHEGATAVLALGELLKLLKEEQPNVEPDIQTEFEDALEISMKDLQALITNPSLKIVNGKRKLTQAHVTAQLICHNGSEFHLPGYAPEGEKSRPTRKLKRPNAE
jgi:hypothetical protein